MAEPTLKVLSLGAGVQSTAVILMALHGEFGRMPDAAIFADTQAEPQAVYDHLDWLEREVAGRMPVYRVTAGDLASDVMGSKRGRRFASIPLYVQGQDGRYSMLRRQCTREYKVEPIERQIRALLGVQKGRRVLRGTQVEQWFGISMDEAVRMKDNPTPWITNYYPLVEKGLTRWDCLMWLERNGYPKPPKSSCIFCPFHSDAYWRQLQRDSPGEWQQAVEFDRQVRSGLKGVLQEAYLHRSLVPLDQADLRTKHEKAGQMTLEFIEECEGHCGL